MCFLSSCGLRSCSLFRVFTVRPQICNASGGRSASNCPVTGMWVLFCRLRSPFSMLLTGSGPFLCVGGRRKAKLSKTASVFIRFGGASSAGGACVPQRLIASFRLSVRRANRLDLRRFEVEIMSAYFQFAR